MRKIKRRTRMLLAAALGSVAALILPGQVPPPAVAPGEEEIRALLQSRLVPGSDAGFVVGLVTPAGERVIAVGKAGPGGAPALDGDTIFEICSITKTFTAAILGEMVERGEVALDDPLARFLPASVRLPERNGRKITLLDLATQSSSLPPIPFNMNLGDMSNPYAAYTVPLLYEFLASYPLTMDIGSQFLYSNLGFGLLGHALELKTGLGYEALVRQRILGPLGMEDTAVSLSPAQRARLAIGHNGASGQAVPNWDFPVLAGAGALRSSVNDMLKYLRANLAASGPLAKVLRSCQEPCRPTNMPGNTIGLAWLTEKGPTAEVVWHNGQTGGYHSFIGFDRQAGRGVVILHNTNSAIEEIGFYLVDPRRPRPAGR